MERNSATGRGLFPLSREELLQLISFHRVLKRNSLLINSSHKPLSSRYTHTRTEGERMIASFIAYLLLIIMFLIEHRITYLSTRSNSRKFLQGY